MSKPGAKKTLIALAACVLIAASLGVAFGDPFGWLSAEDGASARPVTLYGNIEIRDAQLAFNGAEHIASVLVEEGDRVSAGDRLAELQTDRLDESIREALARRNAQRDVLRRLENGTRPQEIAQARARLRSAQARLANAQLQLDRLRESADADAASRQELDDAIAERDVRAADVEVRRDALELALEGPREEEIAEARSRLEQFEAALERLRLERADAVLTAPTNGVVQSRILEPGEYATPDRPILSLALTDRKWVRAYLPEPQLGLVDRGMRAAVESDSFPDRGFDGRVGFISPTAEFTPKTVETTDLRTKLVYEIRINIDDPDGRLRLGQPVTVRILPDGADDTSGADSSGKATP